MSAIFGILRFDGDHVSHQSLEHMANALAHRGPDGRRFISLGAAGLGHCSMHVNAEDRFEAQPLYDPETEITLVADCRIDNRQELAGVFGLAPQALSRTPDSAFILHAYKRWGDACAAHLLGDFAFAIWDGRAGKLLLGRDHMGQRYVHYHRNARFFAFATEIKGLWSSPEVPRKLNEDQLGRFLLADLRPRRGATIFQDIFGLRGGTTLVVRADGACDERRYWQPEPLLAHLGRDEDYYVEAYRRLLGEAVSCRISRLIAPPALCLSAGYDSAGIAGVCGATGGSGGKLIAVSSVLPTGGSTTGRDVRPWVERCRSRMPHLDVRYVVRSAHFSDHRQQAAFATSDDIPFVFNYVLESLFGAAAAAGARLVMDGIGGDLTINPRGGMALASLLRRGKFTRFLREVAAERRRSGATLARVLRAKVIFPLAPHWARRAWLELRGRDPAALRTFVAPEFVRELRRAGAIDMANIPALQASIHMREANARSLRDLADRPRSYYANEAAAHGLDLSRPMLDRRLVEFGLAIPEDLYVVDGRRRCLARRALADVYPSEYQRRDDHQDALDPDLAATICQSAPHIRAVLRRLGSDPDLHRHFAIGAMARVWEDMSAGPIDPATATYALRALQAAAYVHWLGRSN